MAWPDAVPHRALPPGPAPVVFAPDDKIGSEERLAEPPRILIVEDDYLVAMEAEAALTDAGFAVAGIAASAEEAIALAASHAPQLVVMDVRLAGHRDGVDAALELSRAHGIRCVFATAHADPQLRARAQPADPLGWLQKPYMMGSLVAMVRRALKDLGGR